MADNINISTNMEVQHMTVEQLLNEVCAYNNVISHAKENNDEIVLETIDDFLKSQVTQDVLKGLTSFIEFYWRHR